jgi:hypothetical protein
MRVASLVIPPGPGHVRTARLLAASVARQCGFTSEVVEDVRLAVSEACLLHLGVAQPLHVDFDADDEALVIAVGPSALPSVAEPDSQLAMTLLRALVPGLEVGDDGLRMTWPVAAG